MRTTEFDFYLPSELIAQFPTKERSASRLLRLNGNNGLISNEQFIDICQFIDAGDLLIFNNTKVIKARLAGQKESGGAIEALIEGTPVLAAPDKIGRARRVEDARGRYIHFAKSCFPEELRLDGLKIVIDCAHGAAYNVAPSALWELGADIVPIGVTPNGTNINDKCGSTHPELLQETVVASGANIGIALDGDADRLIIVDEHGRVVDGDQIMAILALSMKERGQLARNTLVATVMSNLGLKIAMKENGIDMIETKVGDRYVLEEIRAKGYTLGGEQSGHVIFSQYATTGDGILTGLKIAAEMNRKGKSLAELAAVMQVYPQILINVPGVDKTRTDSDEEVQAMVRECEADLHGTGRVLLRASGTEQLVRVMVEAADEGTAKSWAERIARVVEQRLSLK